MTISQYWSTVADFSGAEAAYLILGIEPEDKQQETMSSFNHLIKQMKLAFLDSCAHLRYCAENGREWDSIQPDYWNGEDIDTFALFSVQMDTLIVQCYEAEDSRHYEDYRDLFLEWLDGAIDRFEQQRFSRDELAGWLDGTGIVSQFQFRSTEPESPEVRREKVKALLAEYGGNKAEVARVLGISRQRVQQLSSGKSMVERNNLRNSPQDPFRLASRPRANGEEWPED